MNKKLLSLVLSLVMVLGTFTSVFAAETTKEEAKPAEKAEKVEKIVGKDNKVQYLIDKKLVEGDDKGEFNLNSNIKRSEITKLLVFANGNEELSKKLQGTMKLYKDVDTTYWANGVIAVGTTVPSSANNQAMLQGYPDGNFLPENNVTYAELSKMLVVLVKEDLTADDVKKANANWAGQWMSWAAQLGILDDVTVADSNAAATREDAFTMMYNALYKMQAFKRVPANEKLGVLSELSNKKLVLNQEKDTVYTITDDTVFVRNAVNGKVDTDNVVKVSSVKNPEYYLGSLVRVMTNDKKEVTHILELGNPDEGALSNKRFSADKYGVKQDTDNKRWDNIADETITTEMTKFTSIKDKTDADIKAKANSWAKIGFKGNDDTKVNSISVEVKESADRVKEVFKADVNDNTKVFVANPANNQMKEVKDVYEALRLIGFRDTNKAIPNVYIGYNSDSRTTSKNKIEDTTAKVIVFNVVSKNDNKSEKYRVINETSSKGNSILEDVDAKKYEENDFSNNKYFPYNYGELYDVIELEWDNNDKAWDIETLIEADDTKKFPIVEVTEVDGNIITVKDENKNTAVLNVKDADVFTKKLKENQFIQFEMDGNSKKEVATISIRDDKNKAKGYLNENLIDFEKGMVYGELVNIEGRRITVKQDRDLTDVEFGKQTEVFVLGTEIDELKIGQDVRFYAKEYDNEFQASNIEVKVGNTYVLPKDVAAREAAIATAEADVTTAKTTLKNAEKALEDVKAKEVDATYTQAQKDADVKNAEEAVKNADKDLAEKQEALDKLVK